MTWIRTRLAEFTLRALKNNYTIYTTGSDMWQNKVYRENGDQQKGNICDVNIYAHA